MIGGTFLPQTGEFFCVEPEAEFSVCSCEERTGDNGKALLLLLLALGFAALPCDAEDPSDLPVGGCDFDGAAKEI